MDVFDSFIKHNISPSIVKAPTKLLTVEYDYDYEYENGVSVQIGKELKPNRIQYKPKVSYTADKDAFYTLCFIDPDLENKEHQFKNPVKHWLVVNIPGNDVEAGEVITDYIGHELSVKITSEAFEASIKYDLHRYIFLLFKQQDKIDASDEIRDTEYSHKERNNWNFHSFIFKYRLGQPVAGNFFLCRYTGEILSD
uniref:Phosphatidylethanolamine-binding protein n=1 Tax=Rhabditophanes sp. KR3021 TaxID=114890 RepID=A0AC35TMT1_9BILA